MKTLKREPEDRWSYSVYAKEGETANVKGIKLNADGKEVKITVRKTDAAYMEPETTKELIAMYPDGIAALWDDVKRGRDIRLRLENIPAECVRPGSNPQAQQEKANGRGLNALVDALPDDQRAEARAALKRGDIASVAVLIAANATTR